jgi:hypothetical protein
LVFNPHWPVFDRVFCTFWVDWDIKLAKKIILDFFNFLAAKYDFFEILKKK